MSDPISVSPLAASVLLVLFGGIGGYAAVYLVSTLFTLIGFSAIGVTGGSYAAGWQAAIGNVAAGSWFASLTSAAMSGGASMVYIPAALASVVNPLIALINGVVPGSWTHIVLNQIHNLVQVAVRFGSNATKWWWT
jgi:hypothetical protein